MILQLSSLAPLKSNRHRDHGVHRLSETQLLAAVKRGRSEAFEALCEAHTARLFQAAFRITRNREDAEDALKTRYSEPSFTSRTSMEGQASPVG